MEWQTINKGKLLCLTALFFPVACFANGGGPLLLLISGSAFLYGQLWIIVSETVVYHKLTGLEARVALKQVFLVNPVSTLVVGLGFPFLLAALTAAGMFLPAPFKDISSLLGTWAYENASYTELLGLYTVLWLLVTFVLTIDCERWHLTKIWNKSGFSPSISVTGLMVRAHLVSYLGLFGIILYMWGGMFSALFSR